MKLLGLKGLHAEQLELHKLYLDGLLLSLQLRITDSSVGMRHPRDVEVTLLLREPVGTSINRGSNRGLIRPLLCIDVHVVREHIGQLIVFLGDTLLVVDA